MKRISLFIFLLCASQVHATDEQDGFQTLPFGSSYEKTVEYLRTHIVKPTALDFFNRDLKDKKHSIQIIGFHLDDLEVYVNFYLNHNYDFYGFSFNTTRAPMDSFDSVVYKNGEFLSRVFINKYGYPQKCSAVRPGEISPGLLTTHCKWDNTSVYAYTGFTFHDGSYFAEGFVYSLKMYQDEKDYQYSLTKAKADRAKGSF